jgi:hypothetical protein
VPSRRHGHSRLRHLFGDFGEDRFGRLFLDFFFSTINDVTCTNGQFRPTRKHVSRSSDGLVRSQIQHREKRKLCIKVAGEKDPKKLELLKERLRLLLLSEETPRFPTHDEAEPN